MLRTIYLDSAMEAQSRLMRTAVVLGFREAEGEKNRFLYSSIGKSLRPLKFESLLVNSSYLGLNLKVVNVNPAR